MSGHGSFGRYAGNQTLPRHRHVQAYAAVVLSGGYEECGSRGRLAVKPGHVVMHARFEAHLDRFCHRGAQVLDIPLRSTPAQALGCIDDPDSVARLAETDPIAAEHHLLQQLRPAVCTINDWPALLAQDLLAQPECSLGEWAEQHGLAAETVSRGFSKIFGFTPAQFRLETRSQNAVVKIMETATPLAAIATAAGFADQAHMTRAVRKLTGITPSGLRVRSNPFKTAAAGMPISAA